MMHSEFSPPISVFFTVSLAARGGTLLLDQIDVLRAAVLATRRRRPFEIDAWVVLPDHMHAVWTVPPEDANVSDRWGAIKAHFSKHVRILSAQQPPEPELFRNPDRSRHRGSDGAGIWQKGFRSRKMESRAMTLAHIRRCHMDPVRHGLVRRPEDWLCTSLHRDLREGRSAIAAYPGQTGEQVRANVTFGR